MSSKTIYDYKTLHAGNFLFMKICFCTINLPLWTLLDFSHCIAFDRFSYFIDSQKLYDLNSFSNRVCMKSIIWEISQSSVNLFSLFSTSVLNSVIQYLIWRLPWVLTMYDTFLTRGESEAIICYLELRGT